MLKILPVASSIASSIANSLVGKFFRILQDPLNLPPASQMANMLALAEATLILASVSIALPLLLYILVL